MLRLITIVLFCFCCSYSIGQCVTAAVSTDTNLCIGDTVYLTCSFDPACFLTPLPAGCVDKLDSLNTQSHVQGGTPFMAKSIYGNFYKGYRFQFLYTADEIKAVFDTGYIKELRWRIALFNSNASLENFVISMKNISSDSTVLTDWQDSMTIVYGPQVYTPKVIANGGWNKHPLIQPYYWDGISNLVIEVHHYNPYTSNNLVNMMAVTTDTGKVLYAVGSNDVYADNTSPIPWHEKPVLTMQLCESPIPPPTSIDTTTTILWTSNGPDAVQYDSNGNAFAVISKSQQYTVRVLRNGILKTSVPQTVSLLPKPKILPTAVNICDRDTTLFLQQVYDTYLWSTGDTTSTVIVSDSGWYKITVTISGCVFHNEDSVFINSILPPPIILPGSFALCEGKAHSIYTSQVYDSYVWSTSDTGRLITVSDSGWYSVTVSKNNCIAHSKDSIYVYAVPPMNAYVSVTPGANAGENIVTVLPEVATSYWMHRTYDTINGDVYVTSMPTHQTMLNCYKDSASTITSNFVCWVLVDVHGCRDTTDWTELTNCITGLTEHSERLSFSVFPNPAEEYCYIQTNGLKGDVRMQITDMQGRVVMQHTYTPQQSITALPVNTSQLATGTYMVRIFAEDKSGQTLLVK